MRVRSLDIYIRLGEGADGGTLWTWDVENYRSEVDGQYPELGVKKTLD